jgi:hypothetical protein
MRVVLESFNTYVKVPKTGEKFTVELRKGYYDLLKKPNKGRKSFQNQSFHTVHQKRRF